MVLRIQGLTVVKLQTSFSRDIGYQNLNTLIVSCECCFAVIYLERQTCLFSYLRSNHPQLTSPSFCSNLACCMLITISIASFDKLAVSDFTSFSFGANTYVSHATHNSSIRSDEGLTLETSTFESRYGG